MNYSCVGTFSWMSDSRSYLLHNSLKTKLQHRLMQIKHLCFLDTLKWYILWLRCNKVTKVHFSSCKCQSRLRIYKSPGRKKPLPWRSDGGGKDLLERNQSDILNGHWWEAHSAAPDQSFCTTTPSQDSKLDCLILTTIHFTASSFLGVALQMIWSLLSLLIFALPLLSWRLHFGSRIDRSAAESNNFLICWD